MDTVAELIEALRAMPQDLRPYLTNGDLPPAPVGNVTVTASPGGYGQAVLISR